MTTVALNGSHHSTIKLSNECSYWGSLVFKKNQIWIIMMTQMLFDQISDKNEKNLSNVLNDNQELNDIFIVADYSSDQLSTNEIFKRSDENISQESNLINLISTVTDPYSSNQF
ncbi:unnamed protein product [Schistosoma margrebowiei]|uniref:Uncharacterized protein n=1 Tax=Schistosoma margrebowiei TaxID=48269 RepID=A0A183M399_9TREM|nr:unnamed protein product [Schistosoma margrebowiei]